jgi:mono/diheme cytochrome c family protein
MKQALMLFSAALVLSSCRPDPDGDLPAPYREIRVPTARLQSAAALDHGRALYQAHCVLCHGVNGDGRGVRREGLTSDPRDFTDVHWRERFSPRRTFWVLREGKPNTAMASFRALSDDDLWDLTAYVLSIAEPHP